MHEINEHRVRLGLVLYLSCHTALFIGAVSLSASLQVFKLTGSAHSSTEKVMGDTECEAKKATVLGTSEEF